MPPETPPATTTSNPFSLIAYVLFQVRHSLEDPGAMGRPPRWIRIARAREATGISGSIGQGVRQAIRGFSQALSYMVELTLDIQELLVQTDAAKALVEVSADFIAAATSDQFIKGVQAVAGISVKDAQNPLSGVGDILNTLKDFLGYIPNPEDVYVLGHELYRLLCIVQEPLPRNPDGTVDENDIPPSTLHHLDVENTGKIRLLQWAFNHELTVFGLGDKEHPEAERQDLIRLGARRLWRTDNANLPACARETWSGGESGPETLLEFFFDSHEEVEARRTQDIKEAFELLKKLGYIAPEEPQQLVFGPQLALRLRRFQALNALPISGELDNATLNRMLHLDFSAKNLRRARPYDAARLPEDIDQMEDSPLHSTGGFLRVVNPGAEAWEEEGLTLVSQGRYPYYVAGVPLPLTGRAPVRPGGGWISDAGGDAIPGFVAVHSRYLSNDAHRFEGGRFSEGEAASGGRFFYGARMTEPWVAGRTGRPRNSIFPAPQDWKDDMPPPGKVARMYQWLPLGGLHRPQEWELYITASVLRRSLYEDRSQTTGLPDQGTLAVEFYGGDVFDATQGGLGTRRPSDRSKELPELRDATRRAPPWPQKASTATRLSDEEVAQKRYWVRQAVEDVWVPRSAVAVLLILEGHYQSGWDIDAYFDDVQVSYTFRKSQPAPAGG